jgi:hypothetical protein
MDELRFPNEDVELLPLGKLGIDRRVQRTSINKAHVKEIASDFDPGAFRFLTVSRRPDGSFVVLDGQHRMLALRSLGHEDGTLVPCDVRSGLSLQQEAALFRLLNRMKNPQPLDKFLVRVVEGDPIALDVSRVTEEAGWHIGNMGAQGFLPAADALERVYTGRGLRHSPKGNQPDALRLTLRILTQAWGHDTRGVAGLLLLGVGGVARRDGDLIDAPAVAVKLAKFAGGPSGVIGKAKSIAVGGKNVANTISFVVVQLHNQKRRTRTLPDWPLS